MLKVIFTLDSLQTGGAENSILEISSKFSPDTIPVIVFFYKNDFLRGEFEKRGLKVISVGLTGKYQFREGIRRFTEICQKEKPDVVVGTLFRAEIISRITCKKLGIPIVGTFVNDTYSKMETAGYSAGRKLKVGLFWLLNTWTARYCQAFLSNAESIRVSNARSMMIPLEKIKVIYRGRELSKYSYHIEGRLESQKLRFLNVGRLIERKGQLEMIKGFALFTKTYPEAELTIAGEGPFRPVLEQTIRELGLDGKVFLLGNVKNVPELLHTHDLFVFPSHSEGFSGALVEAMLTGIPILASDILMNKEAVTHLETGYLFPVTKEKEIASGMAWVNANRPEAIRMAKEARIRAEKEFDIYNIAAQHEQFYRELAGKQKSVPVAEIGEA